MLLVFIGHFGATKSLFALGSRLETRRISLCAHGAV